jgi:hypothetical protein
VNRVLYGAFITGVAAFIVSNVWQVGVTIFGDQNRDDFPKVGEACGAAIEQEIAAIDKGRSAAALEKDAESAKSRFAARPKIDLKAACSGDPNGVDALAAVERLDRSAESHVVRDANEIGPVRQGARSFIRVPR